MELPSSKAKTQRSGVQAIAKTVELLKAEWKKAATEALNVTRGAVSQWLSAYRDIRA